MGVEHLLLGLLRVGGGTAAVVLRREWGITEEAVRARMLEILAVGERERRTHQAPFTPRAKKVLELALREALALEGNAVGTEHLLLGIAREEESLAMRILREGWDLSAQEIRRAVIESLPARRPHAPSRPKPPVVEGVRSLSVHVELSEPARRLVMAAAALALDGGRTEVELDDLWLALTREPTSARLASELGIDEAALREAIRRRDSGGAGGDGGDGEALHDS